MVRVVTVQTPSRWKAESDHNLFFGNVHLLGRIELNRRTRVGKNWRGICLPRVLTDPDPRVNLEEAIATKIVPPQSGTYTSSVADITSVLTETYCGRRPSLRPLLGACK